MKKGLIFGLLLAAAMPLAAQELGAEYRLKRVIPVEGRQGIAADSAYYYVSGSTALYKYDKQAAGRISRSRCTMPTRWNGNVRSTGNPRRDRSRCADWPWTATAAWSGWPTGSMGAMSTDTTFRRADTCARCTCAPCRSGSRGFS